MMPLYKKHWVESTKQGKGRWDDVEKCVHVSTNQKLVRILQKKKQEKWHLKRHRKAKLERHDIVISVCQINLFGVLLHGSEFDEWKKSVQSKINYFKNYKLQELKMWK